jgi:hypothetical protein
MHLVNGYKKSLGKVFPITSDTFDTPLQIFRFNSKIDSLKPNFRSNFAPIKALAGQPAIPAGNLEGDYNDF